MRNYTTPSELTKAKLPAETDFFLMLRLMMHCLESAQANTAEKAGMTCARWTTLLTTAYLDAAAAAALHGQTDTELFDIEEFVAHARRVAEEAVADRPAVEQMRRDLLGDTVN